MKMLIDKLKLKYLHRFSLVAVKDEFKEYANRFLMYYDKGWNCWFFFSFHTSETQNEEQLSQRISNQLKIPQSAIRLEYISDRLQPKHSVKDDVDKVYQHSLYQCHIKDFTDVLKNDEFKLDGIDYRWMTIDDMENDDIIMKVNKDVVSFVKEKIV
jgi:hypothetical protein